jgi:hypothetical protein
MITQKESLFYGSHGDNISRPGGKGKSRCRESPNYIDHNNYIIGRCTGIERGIANRPDFRAHRTLLLVRPREI